MLILHPLQFFQISILIANFPNAHPIQIGQQKTTNLRKKNKKEKISIPRRGNRLDQQRHEAYSTTPGSSEAAAEQWRVDKVQPLKRAREEGRSVKGCEQQAWLVLLRPWLPCFSSQFTPGSRRRSRIGRRKKLAGAFFWYHWFFFLNAFF